MILPADVLSFSCAKCRVAIILQAIKFGTNEGNGLGGGEDIPKSVRRAKNESVMGRGGEEMDIWGRANEGAHVHIT